MNDDQVMTTLLDRVPVLRMETTVQTILARGDRVRKLRRMSAALAAAAVAACLALAVPAMLPAWPSQSRRQCLAGRMDSHEGAGRAGRGDDQGAARRGTPAAHAPLRPDSASKPVTRPCRWR